MVGSTGTSKSELFPVLYGCSRSQAVKKKKKKKNGLSSGAVTRETHPKIICKGNAELTLLGRSTWMSWDRTNAYSTGRAYNYVHVAATYWALYRAGRAYPDLLTRRTWEWYLDQAYETVMKCMTGNVGYSREGLMGETVFGEILADLKREGRAAQVTTFEASMRARARRWDALAVPFGSEMAWDSTGQEGVYYWSR